MNSHTIPKKLLEQFAYDDPVTRSKRLWRYQKGFAPWWKASPKTATRWDGHFSHPANAAKEEELEQRLKREFEDPVNDFIETISSPSFSWTMEKERLLTGYMRMLFHRSRARQAASTENARGKVDAARTLLMDDAGIAVLANYLLANMLENGIPLPRAPWTPKRAMKDTLRKHIAERSGPEESQRDYIQALETMMTFPDETMLNGRWDILHTDPEHPFAIGDAPVVTWERTERTEQNGLYFGIGFACPNVEVFLPISPLACIRVLPQVERTREVRLPTPVEVNMAQASFATEHCFANVCSPELDATLQTYFGKMRMGIDGFNLNHIDAIQLLFDIMRQGRAAHG
jgi:hypothetical protein